MTNTARQPNQGPCPVTGVDQGYDRLPPEQLAGFQTRALNRVVEQALRVSPYYRRIYESIGLDPGDIKTLDDFQHLPVIQKEELRAHNWEFMALGKDQWAEMFSTSGSTGAPVYFPYAESDLQRLERQCAYMAWVAGLQSRDVIQICVPLGASMWIAGLCFWMGFRRLGACTLRYGSGNTRGQVENLSNLGATAIYAVSSYALKLGLAARDARIGDRIPMELILAVNENISHRDFSRNELGRRLQEAWPKARIAATYGNTELGWCGAECEHQRGYHYPVETIFMEVLDPVSLRPVPSGREGTLVVTHLDAAAMPLIRYNIGDLTTLHDQVCACGRNAPRFGYVTGRFDEMVKVKGGVNVYPGAVQASVMSVEAVEDFFFEAFTDSKDLQVKLRICVAGRGGADAGKLAVAVRRRLREDLKVDSNIEVVDIDTVSRRIHVPDKRKPQRFWDLRKTD